MVCHHLADDEANENDQDDRDQDGPGIGSEPGHGEHLLSVLSITDLFCFGKSDLFRQGRRFFIRPEELEAHEAEKRDRDDEADRVRGAGDGKPDLIDDQGDRIGEQALIADGDPRLFHIDDEVSVDGVDDLYQPAGHKAQFFQVLFDRRSPADPLDRIVPAGVCKRQWHH